MEAAEQREVDLISENLGSKRTLERTMMKNEEDSARVHAFYESKIQKMQDTFHETMHTFSRQLEEQLSWQAQQADEVSAFSLHMLVSCSCFYFLNRNFH